MENPYWHEFSKPHTIDFDEIRTLCFEAFAIVATSRSLAGLPGEEVGGTLHEYFWRTAEARLSKALLDIAIRMRTFEDTISDADVLAAYNAVLTEHGSDGELGLFGWNGSSLNEWSNLLFREACNKIIHAEDLRPTYDNGSNARDEDFSWGMTGVMELMGAHGKRLWEVRLNIEAFLYVCMEVANAFKPLAPKEPSRDEDENLSQEQE